MTFLAVAARNRSFTAGEEKRKRRRSIAALMPGLIRHKGKGVRMRRSRDKSTRLRLASADGHLSEVGRGCGWS